MTLNYHKPPACVYVEVIDITFALEVLMNRVICAATNMITTVWPSGSVHAPVFICSMVGRVVSMVKRGWCSCISMVRRCVFMCQHGREVLVFMYQHGREKLVLREACLSQGQAVQ